MVIVTCCPTENSRLDPNDPRNAELLQLIESIPSSSEQAKYFKLANVDDVQRFISDDEFNMDKRFTMLYMRDQGVIILFVVVLYIFVKQCLVVTYPEKIREQG